jgi:hypothetical protein
VFVKAIKNDSLACYTAEFISADFFAATELFPNEIIPNVKILNLENGKNPKHNIPKKGLS